MDLNALFGEFLKKAIEAAVEAKTKELVERITELEQQVNAMDSKVDDLGSQVENMDVERAVESQLEGMNLNEMLDMDRVVEDVICCRQFNVAVKESLIDSLSRSSNY